MVSPTRQEKLSRKSNQRKTPGNNRTHCGSSTRPASCLRTLPDFIENFGLPWRMLKSESTSRRLTPSTAKARITKFCSLQQASIVGGSLDLEGHTRCIDSSFCDGLHPAELCLVGISQSETPAIERGACHHPADCLPPKESAARTDDDDLGTFRRRRFEIIWISNHVTIG